MKKLKVTIQLEMSVPDDWELSTTSEGGQVLKLPNDQYLDLAIEPLFAKEIEISEYLFDRCELLFKPRVRGVDDMQKQVSILEFLKRCLECCHEILRQISDKAYRIRDDHFAVPRKSEPSACRVQGRKEFILNKGVTARERIQKR